MMSFASGERTGSAGKTTGFETILNYRMSFWGWAQPETRKSQRVDRINLLFIDLNRIGMPERRVTSQEFID